MFFKLIAEAIKSIKENFNALGNALIIPFLLYVALYFSGEFIEEPYLVFFVSLLPFGIDVLIAVTTHRIMLLGPESVPQWGLYKWTMRETFFALHVVGLWVIVFLGWLLWMAIAYVAGNIASFLIVFLVIGAVIIFPSLWGRLSLVFPSIAIDKKTSFKNAWKLSEGYELVMALVVIVLPVFLLIPAIIMKFLASPSTLEDFSDLNNKINMISTLLTPPVLVFSIAILSVAYKFIKEEKAKMNEEPPALDNQE